MRRFLSSAIGVLLLALAAAVPQGAQGTDDWIMYVGTYTKAPSKGIYAYRFEGATGKATPMGAAGLAAETENPSFLAVHPNQRFLYAVNELAGGTISAFAIDRNTGTLTLLNRVSTRGADPCHLSLDRTGKWLFVANYTGGSVAAFPVRDDGTLGEASAFFQHEGKSVNAARQSGPHAHETVVSPDNKFVLAVDLGLDKVFTYRLDPARGGLAPEPQFTAIAAGSGPRHLAFRPDGKFAYVVNEMLASVTAFRYDAGRGTLAELQTISALQLGRTITKDDSGAEIATHPGGKFLYASIRGYDSIATFRIDAEKGTLTSVHRMPTGKTPRGFAIDPSGRFLVVGNQNAGTLDVFRIDQRTGEPSSTGTVIQVGSPVSVVFSKKGL